MEMQCLSIKRESWRGRNKRILSNNAAGTLNKENNILQNKTGDTLNSSKHPTSNSLTKPTEEFTGDQYTEVVKFLASVKLQKYIKKFVDNGFEDLETILELNEGYLETIGIPLGHKLKIMKRIKQINNENEEKQQQKESFDIENTQVLSKFWLNFN